MEHSPQFDVFLSHSRTDAEWVETLAKKLEDEHHFRVWLDRWTLIPGESWQNGMGKGIEQAATCAVCLGGETPRGWFSEEIERALDLQTKKEEFRVIPVLLPDAKEKPTPGFLSLKTWADFRIGQDPEFAFHVLVQGIRGKPIGRWLPKDKNTGSKDLVFFKQLLDELKELQQHGLYDDVVKEFQRKIMTQWLEGRG